MEKLKLHYFDIWGNDEEGYDNNQTYSITDVEIPFDDERNPSQEYLENEIITEDITSVESDGTGWTINVDENTEGRHCVPKYYLTRE